MFIECNHCQATYKIDSSRIPKEKSLVKCSQCSKKIYLPYEGKTNHKKVDKIEVRCKSCASNYGIPIKNFKSDKIKVKCGKCGYVFQVSKNPSANKTTNFATKLLPSENRKSKSLEMENIAIPKESIIEVDNLFEGMTSETDLNEEIIPKVKTEKTKNHSSEDEYLESVKIIDENDDDQILSTIGEEQKFKFFLDPNKTIHVDSTNDSPKTENLFDEDKIEVSLIDESDENSSIEAMLQDDLNREIDFVTNEPNDIYDDRQISYTITQTPQKPFKISPFIFITIIFILFFGIIIGSWIILENNPVSDNSNDEIPIESKEVDIIITGKLKGKEIYNKKSNKTLFILSGNLKNTYQTDQRIGWIEVEGELMNPYGKSLAKSRSYAGNLISDEDLEKFEKDQIVSTLGSSNGKNHINNDILKDGSIDFQIVFFDPPNQIGKLSARIYTFVKQDSKFHVNH